MPDQSQGPLYEYMMGTFDLGDPTWMNSMNDMLNNFGLAGWKRSVVTLLDARHLLVVMERRWPTAAEYAASQPAQEAALERGEDRWDEGTAERLAAKYRKTAAPEPEPEMQGHPDIFARAGAEVDEYDDEAEAMMSAKVAEVIPWARQAKVPQNGRRKGAKGPQRKKHVQPVRNKAAT